MKIRYKLYVLFLLLAVVPLAVIGYISYTNAKDAIFQQQSASLQSIVESRVFDVELLIELRKEQASLISGNYFPRQIQPDGTLPADVQEAIQAHFQSTLFALQGDDVEQNTPGRQTRSFIERIELTGLNGRILASTDEDRNGLFYDKVLMNRLPEPGAFFGGYLQDEHTGKYFLTIISDVTNYDSGELSGAVILSVHPGILQQIAGNEPGLQNTGEVLIIDLGEPSGDEARVIAGIANETTHGQAISVHAAEFENTEIFDDFVREGLMMDYQGREVLAISRELPDMNWVVTGTIDAAEIFEPVYAFRSRIVLAVLLISFLSVLIAYAVSSSATGLIDKLVQTFSKLSKGKLAAPLSINRKDEFGELARSANQTADYLNKKIESANQIASGRYGEEVHRVGEEDQLGAALQAMRENLKKNQEEITGLIKGLKTSNNNLAEERARLQAVFDTSTDAIITLGEDGQIESVNNSFLKMFGYTEESELEGADILSILTRSPLPDRNNELGNSFLIKSDLADRVCDTLGIRRDGTQFPASVSLSKVKKERNRVIALIIRDLSHQKKLERKLLESINAERRQIGNKIHEGLGQTLTGLHMITENIAMQLRPDHPELSDEIREIAASIKKADMYTQELFLGLVEVNLEKGGLALALKKLCKKAENSSGIRTHLLAGDSVELDDHTAALHLYHIAREAVQNAMRHASATNIRVQLFQTGKETVLTVEDDGTGFELKESGLEAVGIELMQYRAGLMDGELTIERLDNKTTRVRCAVPNSALQSGS
jgi:two-component system, LuxR family, sensor kinase FixL